MADWHDRDGRHYPGRSGHTYAFYSVATDNVGNVEAAPSVADATTTAYGDAHLDGTANIADFAKLRNNFNQATPAPSP